MKSEPGTYALILKSVSNINVQIGRWREIGLEAGYYIYVGSAFGPGGVRARVCRHWRADKRKHWHIDYLRERITPLEAWLSYKAKRLEHKWAQALYSMDGISSVQGFGCSDCKCNSHLFYTLNKPDITLFSRTMGSEVEVWSA